MSALRSAIHYIKALQSLVAECDAGTLSQEIYSTSAALDTRDTRARDTKGISKQRQTRRRPIKKRPGPSSPSSSSSPSPSSSSSSSSPPSDKWTHYSPAQLRQRFCPQETGESQAGGQVAVNEISLHISLLDSVPSAASTQTPVTNTSNQQPVLYILQLEDKSVQQ